MSVPKRRYSRGVGAITLFKVSNQLLTLLDINFVWQRVKTAVLYGFGPLVIYCGLQIEPKPSIIDLFNIWE
jgi:hypothetical protein